MRTTLDIDDDVLRAVKKLARVRQRTLDEVLSELLRKGLEAARGDRIRNGVPLTPRQRRGTPRMTMARVNELRDEIDRGEPS